MSIYLDDPESKATLAIAASLESQLKSLTVTLNETVKQIATANKQLREKEDRLIGAKSEVKRDLQKEIESLNGILHQLERERGELTTTTTNRNPIQ